MYWIVECPPGGSAGTSFCSGTEISISRLAICVSSRGSVYSSDVSSLRRPGAIIAPIAKPIVHNISRRDGWVDFLPNIGAPVALSEVPLLRMAAPRRAAMLRYAGPGRHVFKPLVHHPRAHIGRGLANDTDRPHLVDQQLPEFLRDLNAAFFGQAGR